MERDRFQKLTRVKDTQTLSCSRCGRRVSTYGDGNVYVLGEDNSLRLDDKEVDELLEIICQAFE